MIYEIEMRLTQTDQVLIQAESEHEAVAELGKLRDGWKIESVTAIGSEIEDPDPKAFVGMCESCKGAILDGDRYGFDPDYSVYVCNKCASPDDEVE